MKIVKGDLLIRCGPSIKQLDGKNNDHRSLLILDEPRLLLFSKSTWKDIQVLTNDGEIRLYSMYNLLKNYEKL